MPQIDPKDLDNSPMMTEFFDRLVESLIQNGVMKPEAEIMVGRYFERQATPLERALVMHRGVERVTRALLGDDAM